MAKSQSSCGVEYFYLIVSEVKTLITLHGVFQEIPPTVNLPTLVGGAPGRTFVSPSDALATFPNYKHGNRHEMISPYHTGTVTAFAN